MIKLMELMASEELYADPDKFNAALAEYNDLKREIPVLEEEWLELSTTIEEGPLVDSRRAGAIALMVLAWAFRLCAIALCGLIVVLCFSGLSARLDLVDLVIDSVSPHAERNSRLRRHYFSVRRGLPT